MIILQDSPIIILNGDIMDTINEKLIINSRMKDVMTSTSNQDCEMFKTIHFSNLLKIALTDHELHHLTNIQSMGFIMISYIKIHLFYQFNYIVILLTIYFQVLHVLSVLELVYQVVEQTCVVGKFLNQERVNITGIPVYFNVDLDF